MGFVDFTKLSFALSSLAQPFDQMGSISECVFVILSQRKAYTGRFREETPTFTNICVVKYFGCISFYTCTE